MACSFVFKNYIISFQTIQNEGKFKEENRVYGPSHPVDFNLFIQKKKSQIDNLNILNILVIIIVIKSPTLIIGYRSLLAKVAFFPLYFVNFVMQVSNSRISIDPWKIDNV